ncbi:MULTISPECIES: hypothetical protein [Streptomyces]|uniref:Integral membrane protein n=1 Tax=Streptomyces thermodiastaticus TaxID=44061 RepID=A0ABU0KTQ6_9ACTN|nr:hypothetical protein [Streptomyces thermodiastaticus]WSB41440.1 hypothetical protein OG853_11460 [Streptomyces cellulosae]WSB49912.1 hypothetical protein OHA00_22450 [Streptomyces cellulosae]WSB54304.1 hypothetical protein OG880_11015 [Streptomyces cellulosae]WSB91171.1 hypothetical protein OG805_11540 [Streptomyces cellulosae]
MSQERDRRMRRARLLGAVGTAVPVTVALVFGLRVEGGLPWWAVAVCAVPAAAFAGWSGAGIGGIRGSRDEVLEPGERVVGVYTVKPPYREHLPPDAHEGPQYALRVTTRSLEMWERGVLLWRHPLTDLRLLTEGPRLRVHHHDGREAGTMILEPSYAAQEVRLAARRCGAA